MLRSSLIAIAAVGASLALSFAAQAQAPTAATCSAAIDMVNPVIHDAANANAPAKNEAEQLSLQASNMKDQGRFAECVDFANQAKMAIERK